MKRLAVLFGVMATVAGLTVAGAGAASATATPPDPVTDVNVSVTDTSATLTWTNPTSANFDAVVIRYIDGDQAPTVPNGGNQGFRVETSGTSRVLPNLTPDHAVSYTIWTRDAHRHYSTSVSGTVFTTGTLYTISGRVTDSAGAGLDNVQAQIVHATGRAKGYQAHTETTDSDGNYTSVPLTAGRYYVCFFGANATDGATTGYSDLCYHVSATSSATHTQVVLDATHGDASGIGIVLTPLPQQ
jgi:hypothetical protein